MMSAQTKYLPLVLVVLGFATFANSLSGPMLFDDQSAIVLNPRIQHLWPLTDALAPLQTSVLASRPVVNVSFAANYAIGGLSVRGYHLANITIHIVCALLIFGIVRHTLTLARLRARFGSRAPWLAVISAALWMVHPLVTEPVNYITQRTELMMGLFYLATLYCAIRAALSTSPERWYIGAIVSCLLGVGSKESMVTAPIIVVLYDRIFLYDSFRAAIRNRSTLYLGLAASWLELATLISSRANTVGFGTGVTAWSYLLNQTLMLGQYLKLAVWPHGLVLDYGVPRILTLSDVAPQGVLVVLLLLATAAAFALAPMVAFLGGWFFILLAPTSSVVPILTEVGAERRMYLPLAGLVVLVVTGVFLLVGKRARPRTSQLGALAVVVLVLILASVTWRRNSEYASPVGLLQTSVERWPHGRSRFNLAVALKNAGRTNEATEQLRLAVVDNPQAQYVLASDLYDRGQFSAAERQLRQFLVRKPMKTYNLVAGQNLLALSLAQQGKLSDAAEHFGEALQLDAMNPDVHANLAFILLRSGNYDGARLHYEKYLEARPANPFVLTNLATALQALGRPEEAANRWREALVIDPNYAEAKSKLATTAPTARSR